MSIDTVETKVPAHQQGEYFTTLRIVRGLSSHQFTHCPNAKRIRATLEEAPKVQAPRKSFESIAGSYRHRETMLIVRVEDRNMFGTITATWPDGEKTGITLDDLREGFQRL